MKVLLQVLPDTNSASGLAGVSPEKVEFKILNLNLTYVKADPGKEDSLSAKLQRDYSNQMQLPFHVNGA